MFFRYYFIFASSVICHSSLPGNDGSLKMEIWQNHWLNESWTLHNCLLTRLTSQRKRTTPVKAPSAPEYSRGHDWRKRVGDCEKLWLSCNVNVCSQTFEINDQGWIHQPRDVGRQLPVDAVFQKTRCWQQQPVGWAGATESLGQDGL